MRVSICYIFSSTNVGFSSVTRIVICVFHFLFFMYGSLLLTRSMKAAFQSDCDNVSFTAYNTIIIACLLPTENEAEMLPHFVYLDKTMTELYDVK